MNCAAPIPGDDDTPADYRDLLNQAVPPIPISEERIRCAMDAPNRPVWVPWAWAGVAIVIVAFWWVVTALIGGWL